MEINGLPLPHNLLALMEAGRWKAPVDHSGVDRLFPENGGLYLYSIELMESETRTLFELQVPAWHGAPDPDTPPGDIDPHLAVFVGDLGHGFDQPIALDYRISLDQPRVITLRWGDRSEQNRWVFVAPDIKAFAELVKL